MLPGVLGKPLRTVGRQSVGQAEPTLSTCPSLAVGHTQRLGLGSMDGRTIYSDGQPHVLALDFLSCSTEGN